MPRTDRKTEYFQGDATVRLQWLHDILVTYAVFHQTVGYAQVVKILLIFCSLFLHFFPLSLPSTINYNNF